MGNSAVINPEIKSFIEEEHKNHTVVVWSKSYCPYCTSTKTLFATQYGQHDVQVHELDRMPNGNDIQQALAQLTGQRTVPNVFVNGKHVGGNDATQAAHKAGTLQSLLRADD